VPTTRLETFADGVFAIAATLLILDVKASNGVSYAAYGLSFATIGIIWVNHHTVMSQLGAVDRAFLFMTVFFLMTVAFIPFPTQLVAEHIRDGGAEARDAALTYGFTFVAMSISFAGLWAYASRGGRLLKPDADERTVAGITRSFRPGVFVYLAATLVAYLSPIASVCIFAALALFYVLESSLFARDGGRA
jgi:uncharacterized membrane protein